MIRYLKDRHSIFNILNELKLPLGIIFCMWCAAIYCLPLLPVDETRYLSVAWEMFQQKSFIVPLLNGTPYSHKPPFLFWMIMGLWKIFTVNEFFPRIIPLFFSLSSLVLVHKISLLLWPENLKISNLSCLMISTCPVWIFFSSAIMFDMILAFWVLLALWGVLTAGQQDFKGWFIAGFALGCGLLTKGPVIFIHVLPCIVLHGFWCETSLFEKKGLKGLFWFLLIGVFMGLSWAVPAALEGGKEFSQAILWEQTTGRMVTAFAHERPLWWYLPILPALVFPWGLWHQSWHAMFSLKNEKGTKFCLIWSLSALTIFSFISGKQIHYLIPEIPAFMLLISRGLDLMDKKNSIPKPEISIICVYIILGIGLFLLPHFKTGGDLGDVAIQTIFPVAAGIFCLGVILLLFSRTIPRDKARIVALSSVVFIMIIYRGGHGIWQRYELKQISEKIASFEINDFNIVHMGKYQGEFHFLGRLRKNILTLDTFKEFSVFTNNHPKSILIIQADRRTIFPLGQIVYEQKYKNKKIMLLQHLHI